MFFLNLTGVEFFVLLGSLASIITALYLLDRAKRKKVVSTLRFWVQAIHAEERQSRKKMREPWSLVLQLASLLALLLALAQLQWGTREHRGSDHVVVLDTSSWTAERTGQGTVLDREKILARSYIAGLSAKDRVMILRADALTTPVTPFTGDRLKLRKAIDESAPTFSALNLTRALGFAAQVQAASDGAAGEIVYFGPRMVENAGAPLPRLSNLRVIPVEIDRDNCGIRRLAVHRSDEDRDTWIATVTVKNYARPPGPYVSTFGLLEPHLRREFSNFPPKRKERRIMLSSQAPRVLSSPSFSLATISLKMIAPSSGCRKTEHSELPRSRIARSCSNLCSQPIINSMSPSRLHPPMRLTPRPILSFSINSLHPKCRAFLLYGSRPRWTIHLHRSKPLLRTPRSIIGIPELCSVSGRYARDARLARAEVFESFPGDLVIATVDQGPVVVARPESGSHKKLALVGFDPLSESLRFQLTTPLLFADLLRWLSPEAFRTIEATADHVGLLTVSLDQGERADRLKVTDGRGVAVPFTLRGRSLQLFTTKPGDVRIASGDRDRIFSLTLPEVAEFSWSAPRSAASGLPAAAQLSPSAIDLWKWLALLGGVGLLFEWLLYGRHRLQTPRLARPEAFSSSPSGNARELVSK